MEKSLFLKNFLGDHLFNNLMVLKKSEWEEDRTHITNRERRKYLDI